MIEVAISEASITPAPGLRMSGMIDPPAGEVGRWPLFGRVLMLDDGQTRAA
jgi:hypothetical protein